MLSSSPPAPPSQLPLTQWALLWPAGLVALAWLVLSRAPLTWLLRELQQTSGFNLLLLGVIAVFLGIQTWRQRWFTLQPLAWSAAPVSLLVGSALGSVLLPWLLDLDQLPVALFVLGSYGYLGLFLPRHRWQRGLVIAVLLAGLLPFSLQQGTGLGLPMRLVTAKAVSFLLQYLHIPAPSSEDVLVLENGLAQVDLPCSGLKSLWTGSLFLLAATWMRGRQLGGRWLLVWVVSLGLFTLANIGRVLGLVLIIEVWRQPDLGQLLHMPLGAIGFMAVCGLSWLLLGWVPGARATAKTAAVSPTKPEPAQGGQPAIKIGSIKIRSPWLPLGLSLVLLALAGLPQPAGLTATPTLADLRWPMELQRQTLDLTPAETRFFADHPQTQVQKQAFEYQNLSGSMLLVSSASWRAQHAPELCFVGNGFRVNKLVPTALNPDIAAHWLVLNEGSRSATYWFQSPRRTTANFLERLWAQVSRRERQWVMVSLLFNQPLQPQDPALQEFTGTVHQVLAQSWGMARHD